MLINKLMSELLALIEVESPVRLCSEGYVPYLQRKAGQMLHKDLIARLQKKSIAFI
ncbi:MAG: hypothetical protein JSU03_10550 [Bacteroidetes bacterium]|nr:hypothetical protein [Bacteroidota bacterium]MBS1757709.1 hypothetical protein [Bacteroidota bacterium]